jgi:hypothetical protein
MEDQPVLIEQELLQPAASSGAEGEEKRQTAPHEDPKESTTITIAGPGMHFARKISDEQVLSILRLVLGGEQSGYAPEEHRSNLGSPMALPRRQAISEFYRNVAPKRYPEKLVTIAAHLQQTLGRDNFTPEDLRTQFRQVNETPPANLPRDFKAAMGVGWIAEDHAAPGRFYVTQTGLDAVASGFTANGKRISKPRRRRRNSVKKQQGEAAIE